MFALGLVTAVLCSLLTYRIATDANAQIVGDGMGSAYATKAVSTSYTGPGDIVSGATAWYGLRAYSAAVAATGTQKSVNLRRASDNATTDVLIATSGNLGLTTPGGITPAAFAGTDATCTGSMVGTTTLTISACASGTLHVNDPIGGAGINAPAYITAIGTCASPPGTCTVNVAQTFASETVTAQVALFATEVYDQSGNSNNITQATAGSQPQFLPLCANGGTLPCIRTASSLTLASASLGSGFTQPNTFSQVISPINLGGGSNFWSESNLTVFAVSGTTYGLSCGANFGVTTSTNTFHAFNGICNGSSSVINLDGTETTGNAGTNTGSGAVTIGVMQAEWAEAGIWTKLGFSGTQRTNVCGNQAAYWGTTIGAAC